jgi:protocatechuate 3,4-dioxygenase, beta subunit
MTTTPRSFYIPVDRRRFLQSMAAVSAGFTLPGYLAEALTFSPTVTQGPYYPLARGRPLGRSKRPGII